MKEIKDYMHLYLGCECEITCRDYSTAKTTLTAKHIETLIASKGSDMIMPILRPLSDMKKHESNIGDEIMNAYDETNAIEAMQGMANMTMYLLKQGFDLFGLIESGLAIDKTKMSILK